MKKLLYLFLFGLVANINASEAPCAKFERIRREKEKEVDFMRLNKDQRWEFQNELLQSPESEACQSCRKKVNSPCNPIAQAIGDAVYKNAPSAEITKLLNDSVECQNKLDSELQKECYGK